MSLQVLVQEEENADAVCSTTLKCNNPNTEGGEIWKRLFQDCFMPGLKIIVSGLDIDVATPGKNQK